MEQVTVNKMKVTVTVSKKTLHIVGNRKQDICYTLLVTVKEMNMTQYVTVNEMNIKRSR